MSDEKKEPIEIKTSKVSKVVLNYESIDFAVTEKTMAVVRDAVEKQIYKAMAIPAELINEGKTPPWHNTTFDKHTVAMASKDLRGDYLEKLKQLFETPYNKFCREFITQVSEQGLHTDNIDRIRYVFENAAPQVIDLVNGATSYDMDTFVQQFLAIYAEITQ